MPRSGQPVPARLLAAAVVTLLTGTLLPLTGLAGPGATPADAAVSCRPVALHVVRAKARSTRVTVRSSRVRVQQVRARRFVATATVTATSGRGRATASQTVCPNGTAAAPVVSTRSRVVRGTVSKQVRAQGRTRAKAVAAAKRAVGRAKATARATAGRRGTRLALRAASRQARAAAYDALFASRITYLWASAGAGTPRLSLQPHPMAGFASMAAVAGGLRFTVPPTPSGNDESYPCLTRALAWPTTLASGDGSISWSGDPAATARVDTLVVDPARLPATYQWTYVFAGDGSAPRSTPSTNAAPAAGPLLCFEAKQYASKTTGVLTLGGLRLGSAYTGTGAARHVGGVVLPPVVR